MKLKWAKTETHERNTTAFTSKSKWILVHPFSLSPLLPLSLWLSLNHFSVVFVLLLSLLHSFIFVKSIVKMEGAALSQQCKQWALRDNEIPVAQSRQKKNERKARVHTVSGDESCDEKANANTFDMHHR